MKKNLLITIIVLCSVVFVFGGNPGYAGKVPGVTDDTIKIGVISDLTGPAAYIGKAWVKGAELYFNYINSQGGVNGRKVRLFVEDGQFSATRNVAAAKYLISRDQAFAMFGIAGSTHTLAVWPLLERKKIPCMMPVAMSSSFSSPFKKYMFASIATAYDEGVVLIDYLVNHLKPKKDVKIAFFYSNDEMGRDGLWGFRDAAKKYGLKAITEESWKIGGSMDCSSQAFNIWRKRPDYVFNAGILPGLISLLKEFKKFKYSPVLLSTT